MKRFDQQSAKTEVYIFKEGMLGAAGHDLRLVVDRFELEVAGEGDAVQQIRGRWEAKSLRVDAVMVDGVARQAPVPERDRKRIEKSAHEQVLKAKAHPEITFVSESIRQEGDRAEIRGALTIVGARREIAVQAEKREGQWRAKVEIHQPDFGIKPFSAMLGALKVKPTLYVEIALPDTL